jgi:hypothetical protein
VSDARFHFLFGLLPLLGAAVALAGCKYSTKGSSNEDEYPTSRPAALNMEERTLTLPQSSVAVAQGPAPLLYIFNSPASIRVVDLTSGQRLAAANVQARTLVRIDDLHGVTIGADNVAPGRLTPGHQYVIYSDPTTPNTISHGVGRPVDVPKR